MRDIIESLFDSFIREKLGPGAPHGGNPPVFLFLMAHERKQKILDNLCSQVIQTELRMANRFSKKSMEALVETVAGMFMEIAVGAHHRTLMSRAAIAAEQREADLMKDAQAMLDEGEKEFRSTATTVHLNRAAKK